MNNPATPVWLRLKAAAVVLLLLAAACSGSDEGPATAAPETAGTAEVQHDPEMDDMAGGGQDGSGPHDHGIDAGDGHSHDHGEEGGHTMAGAPTRYDADLADASQTITVEVVGGAPVGGVQRVEVDLGSVVALMVASDIAEEVHVHSYDILRGVSEGNPAHFAFTAEIPGVFEVEFEGSGRLLLQLEIS